ncbi:glycosyltransferase [Clostridium septicum]|nr:glycosyltransferase [Clostridium septicum]
MLERKLWIDHVLWTRSFIVSDIASLEDKNDVLHRLFKNQDDIGNSIKPYYGEEAGNKLAVLLRDHIALAGKVLEAAKNKNKDELDKYNKLWYDNADKIADFLSSANPNYNNKELKDMLYKHLQFVTDQVVARLNNNWKDDIESFDKGENHIINFADIISDGIIKQFPEKFQ